MIQRNLNRAVLAGINNTFYPDTGANAKQKLRASEKFFLLPKNSKKTKAFFEFYARLADSDKTSLSRSGLLP